MNQTNQKLPKCSDLRNRAKNEKNYTCLVGGRRLLVRDLPCQRQPSRRHRRDVGGPRVHGVIARCGHGLEPLDGGGVAGGAERATA